MPGAHGTWAESYGEEAPVYLMEYAYAAAVERIARAGQAEYALPMYVNAWQRSDLIIIAGRPAMGKTSFALSLAKNAAVDYKIPVGFFSLEMNNVQLVNRLISNTCRIKGSKILNGQLAPDEWERLDKNLSQLTGSPIYIDDTPGRDQELPRDRMRGQRTPNEKRGHRPRLLSWHLPPHRPRHPRLLRSFRPPRGRGHHLG